MSTKRPSGRVRAVYEVIKAHRGEYSVEIMCRVPRCGAERLLQMAAAAGLETRPRGRPAPAPDSGVLRRESQHLRGAASFWISVKRERRAASTASPD